MPAGRPTGCRGWGGAAGLGERRNRIITGTTYSVQARACAHDVVGCRFEPIGPAELKGVAQPLTLHLAKRES